MCVEGIFLWGTDGKRPGTGLRYIYSYSAPTALALSL